MHRKDFFSIESSPKYLDESPDSVTYDMLHASQNDGCGSTLQPISHQVGEVYEVAPIEIRIKMVEHLLLSIGVLPLVAVAKGVFAKIRFRGTCRELNIKPDDIAQVSSSHVIALVEYVHQVNEAALDGVGKMLREVHIIERTQALSRLIEALASRARFTWDDGEGLGLHQQSQGGSD